MGRQQKLAPQLPIKKDSNGEIFSLLEIGPCDIFQQLVSLEIFVKELFERNPL